MSEKLDPPVLAQTSSAANVSTSAKGKWAELDSRLTGEASAVSGWLAAARQVGPLS
jgi:hypothetical protein